MVNNMKSPKCAVVFITISKTPYYLFAAIYTTHLGDSNDLSGFMITPLHYFQRISISSSR